MWQILAIDDKLRYVWGADIVQHGWQRKLWYMLWFTIHLPHLRSRCSILHLPSTTVSVAVGRGAHHQQLCQTRLLWRAGRDQIRHQWLLFRSCHHRKAIFWRAYDGGFRGSWRQDWLVVCNFRGWRGWQVVRYSDDTVQWLQLVQASRNRINWSSCKGSHGCSPVLLSKRFRYEFLWECWWCAQESALRRHQDLGWRILGWQACCGVIKYPRHRVLWWLWAS